MSPSQIQIGKSYKNRGRGTTIRTVLDIGTHIQAPWLSPSASPDEPVVKYRQDDNERTLYLRSFAQWAGEEI